MVNEITQKLQNIRLPYSFEEYDKYEKIEAVNGALKRHFPVLRQGTTRKVYTVSDEWVLKCPLHPNAVVCNEAEQNIYDEESHYNQNYAQCFTVVVGGIPLLVMERLVTVYELESEFTWNEDWRENPNAIQVGIARDGKIKAFDFWQ